MTSTPPDDLSKLGRESGCKPDGGDISATGGVQTRADERLLSEWAGRICGYELDGGEGPRLCDLLSPILYAQFKVVLREGLKQHAATAIRSLTEERDQYKREAQALWPKAERALESVKALTARVGELEELENMLLLCGELGGMRRGEASADYLRRLIDGIIANEQLAPQKQEA